MERNCASGNNSRIKSTAALKAAIGRSFRISFGIDHLARVCSRSASLRSIGLTLAVLLETPTKCGYSPLPQAYRIRQPIQPASPLLQRWDEVPVPRTPAVADVGGHQVAEALPLLARDGR